MLCGRSKLERRARYSGSSLRRVDRLEPAIKLMVWYSQSSHVVGLQISAKKTSVYLKMRVCKWSKTRQPICLRYQQIQRNT